MLWLFVLLIDDFPKFISEKKDELVILQFVLQL
jgi:hypothetical protein